MSDYEWTIEVTPALALRRGRVRYDVHVSHSRGGGSAFPALRRCRTRSITASRPELTHDAVTANPQARLPSYAASTMTRRTATRPLILLSAASAKPQGIGAISLSRS